MTPIQAIYSWAQEHHDVIEVAVWISGLLALVFASGQLSESRKQRGITESFSLTDKINFELENWSDVAGNPQSKEMDYRRSLGQILTTFEIISDGINRGYLSHMSREILTHQIIGSLAMVYDDDHTKSSHKFICDSPDVCSSFKIFLLNNHKLMSKFDKNHDAFDAIFASSDRALLGKGILSTIERRVRIIRLMLNAH